MNTTTTTTAQLMGYELTINAIEKNGQRHVRFMISGRQATDENEYAPSMMVTDNKVRIQTTAFGTQSIEDYPRFIDASQQAYLVAQEFQKEIDKFLK